MSDWTKVLLTNVVLATAVIVLLFHAPLLSASVGSAGMGLLIWVGDRLDRVRRRHRES
jgi:hypothetical protein